MNTTTVAQQVEIMVTVDGDTWPVASGSMTPERAVRTAARYSDTSGIKIAGTVYSVAQVAAWSKA